MKMALIEEGGIFAYVSDDFKIFQKPSEIEVFDGILSGRDTVASFFYYSYAVLVVARLAHVLISSLRGRRF